MPRGGLHNRRRWHHYITWDAITRTKSVEQIKAEQSLHEASSEHRLEKVLGVWDLISYGIGSTVGAGIFVTSGVVARDEAGPAILLSFVVAGFASLLSAFCYAEFSAMTPVAGSAYTFAYVGLGELWGWFVGWNLTLEYSFAASAVARGWSGYFVDMFDAFGMPIPKWLGSYEVNSVINLSPMAALIIGMCTAVLFFGVEDSAKFNKILAVVNVCIIIFVMFAGLAYVDTANWSPFAPFGMRGVVRGAGTVFFSYIGFDSVSSLSEEVKNPQRDLPIGIVGTLGIATALYVGVSLVIAGMVPYELMDPDAPLSNAFAMHDVSWARIIIASGSVTTLTATTLCSLIGQPRIYYRMAKDGLLFRAFGELHPKYKVPLMGMLVTGLFSAALAFLFSLDDLASMISIGTLLAFTVVCAGIILTRYRDAAHPRRMPTITGVYFALCVVFCVTEKYAAPEVAWVPAVPLVGMIVYIWRQPMMCIPSTFRCPGVPLVPCLGMLINAYLMVQLPGSAFVRVMVWTAIGMAIYFFYGVQHSSLNDMSYQMELNTVAEMEMEG